MPLFKDLAVELIQHIARHLRLEEQGALRSVCSYFQLAVDPIYFELVLIASNRVYTPETQAFVAELSTNTDNPWAKHARGVAIAFGTPTDEYWNEAATARRRWDVEIEENPDPTEEQVGAVSAVAEGLKNLPRVTFARLSLRSTDARWFCEALMGALVGFPCLESVDLRLGRVIVVLPKLSNLTILKILCPQPATWDYDPDTEDLKPGVPVSQQVAGIIERCPQLRVLHLTDHRWDDVIWQTLLRLKLQLVGLVVNIAANSWNMTSNRVPRALLEYLGSYSGLQTLALDIRGNDQMEDDACIFFEEVLPRHAASLQTLRCVPALESAWSVQLGNAQVLSTLENLTRLEMSIDAQHLDTPDDKTNAFHLLVNSIARIPKLTGLALHSTATRTPHFRGFERNPLFAGSIDAALDQYLPGFPQITFASNDANGGSRAAWDIIDYAMELSPERLERALPPEVHTSEQDLEDRERAYISAYRQCIWDVTIMRKS
ncbi:hypothetical protein MIND_00303600 [Mycena indigotica]|uniref:F-box domain-containing protein n=1 Tax=Mycena indigotica TaxID=2126181 RepID=A0A8H6WAN5_9AGAR|nr:uncharacterized protein MIND_00303600 [Mycena indigotica]KAF7309331.1 hypothetical protein MIND_00303600 [Mycena indigotica]